MRRGAYVIPKYLRGMPTDDRHRRHCRGCRWRCSASSCARCCNVAVGDMTDYGLPKPDHKLLEAHPTVSSDLLPRLGHGDITVKPNIDRFDGRPHGPLRRRQRRGDRRRRLLHRLQDHLPVLRPGPVSRPGQPDAALPPGGLRRPPGPLLHRPHPAARRDHAARRGAVGVGRRPARGQGERCPRAAEMRRRSSARTRRMAKRYVASKRHTIQVDFYPYLRTIERERRNGARRNGRLGRLLARRSHELRLGTELVAARRIPRQGSLVPAPTTGGSRVGELAYDRSGSGEPVVLLHGLGSRRRGVRAGHRSPRWRARDDRRRSARLWRVAPRPGGHEASDRRSRRADRGLVRGARSRTPARRRQLDGRRDRAGARAARNGAIGDGLLADRLLGQCRAGLVSQLPSPRLSARAAAGAASGGGRPAPQTPLAVLSSFGKPFKAPAEEVLGTRDDAPRRARISRRLEFGLDYTFENPAELGALPITVAWGRRDVLLPYWTQAPRARRLLPRAHHVTLAGCGHVPFYDDPELCSRRAARRDRRLDGAQRLAAEPRPAGWVAFVPYRRTNATQSQGSQQWLCSVRVSVGTSAVAPRAARRRRVPAFAAERAA